MEKISTNDFALIAFDVAIKFLNRQIIIWWRRGGKTETYIFVRTLFKNVFIIVNFID